VKAFAALSCAGYLIILAVLVIHIFVNYIFTSAAIHVSSSGRNCKFSFSSLEPNKIDFGTFYDLVWPLHDTINTTVSLHVCTTQQRGIQDRICSGAKHTVH